MRDIKSKQYLSINGLTGSFNAFFVAKGTPLTALDPVKGTFQVELYSTPILRPKAPGQVFKNWLDDIQGRVFEAVLRMYRQLGMYRSVDGVSGRNGLRSGDDSDVLSCLLNQAEETVAEAIGQQVRLWLTWSAWHTPVVIQTTFCGSVTTAGDGMTIFRPYSDHPEAARMTSGLTDKVRVLTGLAHLHRRLTNGWSLLQVRSNDAVLHFDGRWKSAQQVKGPESMADAATMEGYDPSADFSWALIDTVANCPVSSLNTAGRAAPYFAGPEFHLEPSFFDKHRLVSVGHPLDDESSSPIEGAAIVTAEFMLKDCVKLGDYIGDPLTMPRFALDCHKSVKDCQDHFWEAHAKRELEQFQGVVDGYMSYPRAVADCITRWLTPISGQYGNAWAGLYKLDAPFAQFLPGKLVVACRLPENDAPTSHPEIEVSVSASNGDTHPMYQIVDDRSYVGKYPVFVPVVVAEMTSFTSVLWPDGNDYGTNLFCSAAQWQTVLSATAARPRRWKDCLYPCVRDEDIEQDQSNDEEG